MKFGVAVANCCEGLIYPIGFGNHKTIVELSRRAEELGYDSVWGNDHISTQKYIKKLTRRSPNYYEPLVSLAFIAEATRKIRLGTGILVLPYRDPVILAKQIATLDNLSAGRLILGVGTGAYREEFQSIHPSIPYEERGVLMDEGIAALRNLLTRSNASFAGRYINFTDIEMFPKPKQESLPLWMGGNSPKVLRRAGKLGDGWLPAMLTPKAVARGAKKIEEYAKRAGRDASKIEIAPQYMVSIAGNREEAVKNFRKTWSYKHLVSLKKTTFKGQSVESFEEGDLIGTPSQISEHIDALEKAGVTYLPAMIFLADNNEELSERIGVFAREVMTSFN